MRVIITGAICFRGESRLLISDLSSISALTMVDSNAGASGVLGSAVRAIFEDSPAEVLPLSLSRDGEGLERLDLTLQDQVQRKFTEFKPDCKCMIEGGRIDEPVIHTTAIRGYPLRCRTTPRCC